VNRGVTPDTAMRLARYFGGDAESLLNLQQAYDLKKAVKQNGDHIAKEVAPREVQEEMHV
jgi:plasmid maintenance system antidote protein VapI